LPPEQRRAALNAWQTAPGARDAHPREEHLLPLMVAAGAADAGSSSDGSLGVTLFDAECMGAKVAGVGFGQFSSQFASRGA
jgi:aromatic ring-opening dioxygenase catalytic subunit (LigB family)